MKGRKLYMEYTHGGDIYTYEGMLDFSVNINPLGASPKVIEAAKRGITQMQMYPDSRCGRLREALSRYLNFPKQGILAGNGAADLIYSIVFAERPSKALIVIPAFSEYKQALQAIECHMEYYETRRENKFCIQDDFLEYLDDSLDMIFLCSPSNPVGQVISIFLLKKIIEECEKKKIRLVLDECFVDFLETTEQEKVTVSMAKQYRYLFILRAFTKIHAIPGLRLGYGITSDEVLVEKIYKIRQPWGVSTPAQEAGIAALSENERILDTKVMIKYEREWMEQQLEEMGFQVMQSKVNYILFQCKYDLFELLKKKKILIRDCSNYDGLEKGWYRVAVRLPEENQRLIQAICEILEEKEGVQSGKMYYDTRHNV